MSGPLYSQEVIITQNGFARLSNIGGPVAAPNGDAKGYIAEPSYGILNLFSPDNSAAILDCVATIEAYQGHPLDTFRLPGQVLIDVPCSVTIAGPPSTRILLQVWPTFAQQSRGAKRTVFRPVVDPAAALLASVPLWANAFDWGGGANLTFYRDAGLTIPTGFFVGANPIVGMSVPAQSAFVQSASVVAALALTFRQQ